MKIYIAHYTPLKDRKNSLSAMMGNNGITNYEFVEGEPSEKFKSLFLEKENREFYWAKKIKNLNYNCDIKFRDLKKSEISLIYKHLDIYAKISKSDYEYALVLEDDVIFHENFLNKIDLIFNETNSNFDLIFLGNGCGLRINPSIVNPLKLCYKKSHPASKCTDSYLISKKAAKIFLDNLRNICLPIDFELNYFMFKYDMVVYWAEPPIFEQGSQNGVFSSSLNE